MKYETKITKLKKICDEYNVDYRLDVELNQYSYFKTGGVASIIIEPKNSVVFACILRYISEIDISYKVIGETSNLLFLDDVKYGCLLSTNKLKSLKLNDNTGLFEVDSGVSLPELSRFALKHSITGYEGFEGIPGSVGGGVFMNAGAYGYEIKDVLVGVELLDPISGHYYLPVESLKLNSRTSVFRDGGNKSIIIKCYFKLKIDDSKKIYKKMSIFHSKRHKYQEFMYPTLGSLYSGSVYRSLARLNILYKIISVLYFLIFYKLKLFMREAPNDRMVFNNITIFFFNFKYNVQPFSDKDMNTLTNRGQHTNDFISYIAQLENVIGDQLRIENEIVHPDF